MAEDASAAARRVPLIIGGLCVALGLGVGLWPRRSGDEDAPPSPVASAAGVAAPSARASASASAAAVAPEVPVYAAPDLGGPDLGEVVVTSAVEAGGLAVAGGALWWLSTDDATLGRARLDGAEAEVLFRADEPERFGGAFVGTDQGIFFSVAGGERDPVYRVELTQAGRLEAPTPLVRGTAPDHFVRLRGALCWADVGNLWRRPDGGEATTVARRDGLVMGLTPYGEEGLAWIEAPLQGRGEHAVGAWSGRTPRRLTTLDAAPRDNLQAAGSSLYWAETRPEGSEDRGHIVRLVEGAAPRVIRIGGLVSHLRATAKGLLWTELYGEGEEAVTLLFSAGLDGADVVRHGRIQGLVTALVRDAGYLYWSGPRGIERHAMN